MAATSLQLEFADGEYTFALKLPQLAELQDKRGCGIFTLYGRVMAGRAMIDGQVIASPKHAQAYSDDIFETIRLALIGGGAGVVNDADVTVGAIRAKQLVDAYVVDAPLRESWAIAAAILGAKIEGYTPPKAPPAPAPDPAEEAAPEQPASI